MSCLTTSATRRSRSVPAAVLIASAAASSHEVLLVPIISVTLYTLMTFSFDHVRLAPGLLRPACHRATCPVVDARQVTAESVGPGWPAPAASPVTAVPYPRPGSGWAAAGAFADPGEPGPSGVRARAAARPGRQQGRGVPVQVPTRSTFANTSFSQSV